MTKGPKDKRDYLVKKWLQLRIALAYLAVSAAGSMIMAAVLVPRIRRTLTLEMFRGHSAVANTWELLVPDVAAVNAAATAIVLLLAAGITLAMLSSVHRSARRLAHDLRAAGAGGDPAAWEPLRRPRELRHLQRLLAEALEAHRRRLGDLDALCAEILERAGRARAAAPESRDLRSLHVLCERLRSQARHIRTE